MNKIVKYALFTAGGIGAVLIAVAAYVAATFNPNDYKPQIVQLVKAKFDRTLHIGGDIKLTFFPALGADLGKVALSERASEKEFAAIDAARVALQLMPLLSRDLVVSRIEMRGLRANVVKHKNGTTNIDDLTGTEAGKPQQKSGGDDRPVQKPMRFNIDHVLIENATLNYADERSGARYTLKNLKLKTGKIAVATPSDIELALALGASQPKVNVDVRLKTKLAFDLANKRFKLDPFNLEVKGEAAGMNPVALNITTSLTVDLAAGTYDLPKLIADLAVTDPKSSRGTVAVNITGAAHADVPKQSARLDFSTRFDESTVTGRAGLARFSPPSYVFDVNVDKLDVDRYTGPKKPEGQRAEAGKGTGSPEQPLDFSALKTLQANGSIKIGSLKVANLKAQNVRLDVKAGRGRLDVNPLTASLYQGSMNGNLSLVAAATPQIAVRQSLTGISIGPLLKDAVDKDMLEGSGNVTLDISGQGTTVAAIKKALNGSAALNLANGALKGINIGAAIRNASAKLGSLRGETTQASNATEKTDFSELKASFKINNGVAHNSDLSMKSPLLRMGGEGDVNIGTESMDYLAKATLVATAAGQGGKEVSELKGVTVPVRISGPFTSLSYKLDFDSMIRGVAQQKLEEKKEELKSKIQDRLKDQLKGLFGR